MNASGSGAASRTVMGTAVFWGMLVATALGVFVTPALYTFIEWFRGDPKPPAGAAPGSTPSAEAGHGHAPSGHATPSDPTTPGSH